MTTEQWLPIPDFPGYEVSDQGRVRSLWNRVRGKGFRYSIGTEPRVLYCGHTDKDGYPIIGLFKNKKRIYPKIHILVARTFLGPRPLGMEICHNDGNPTNNAASNLRYDTHTANMRDAARQGVQFRICRFTCADVIKIRTERANGRLLHSIASEWQTTVRHISSICLGRIYRNAGGPIAQPKRRTIAHFDCEPPEEGSNE